MVFLLVCSFLLVIFLVLPKETGSFYQALPCLKNETCFPFSATDSVEPSSIDYIFRCNHSDLEIKFKDGWNWHTVKDIDCIQKRLVVLDQELGNILDPATCNFLYILDPPLEHFVPPHPILFKNRTSCSLLDRNYFESFLPEFFNLIPCRNYSAYHWNLWKGNSSEFSVMCEINTPHPAVELVLSFSDGNKPLSLFSFGFSAHLKLLKQCFNDNLCKATEESSKTGLIIGLSTAGGFSFIMLCFLCFLIYRRWKKQSFISNFLDRNTSSAMSSKTDHELGSSVYTPIFSFDELYEATNAFDSSKELGDGGFGTVYKGKLKDGRVVAVKRLYESNYRREQFMNEVKIVSQLRHQNLVSLYGCTSRHSRELLLVYEFISNGTIADHLHGSRVSESFLPWKVRMNIAIETADALNYLHSVEPQIIHRDIKTNNIMLDNDFHVKVGDFGLSRLFPLDATHVSTAPQGTPGYLDPEYHKFFHLTDKSDVYSFGVVLMELISSMPAVDMNRELNEANLAYMAIKKIQRQELHEFVDPRLGYHSDSNVNAMITQVAELALQCLQSEREMRPSIKEVLDILRGIEKAGCKAQACLGADDAVKEEACLLKSIPPCSPNSVADRWVSTSSSMSSFSG